MQETALGRSLFVDGQFIQVADDRPPRVEYTGVNPSEECTLVGMALNPQNARPVRVALADREAPTREALRTLLSLSPQIEMVGEAANGLQILDLVADRRPDVVLMDLRMPIMDGLQASREIKSRWPGVRVVTLTMEASRREEAIDAGADRFLVKGGASEELWNSILAVA